MKDRYWMLIVLCVVGLMTIPIVMARIDLTGTQQRHVFWCEESGGLATGLRFSWGNGNINAHGPVQPWSGYVVAMSINAQGAGSGAGRIQMAIDGVAQGTDYQVSTPTVNNGGSYNEFDTPLRFNAGDKLTARCTVADSACDGITIAFWVIYDL